MSLNKHEKYFVVFFIGIAVIYFTKDFNPIMIYEVPLWFLMEVFFAILALHQLFYGFKLSMKEKKEGKKN